MRPRGVRSRCQPRFLAWALPSAMPASVPAIRAFWSLTGLAPRNEPGVFDALPAFSHDPGTNERGARCHQRRDSDPSAPGRPRAMDGHGPATGIGSAPDRLGFGRLDRSCRDWKRGLVRPRTMTLVRAEGPPWTLALQAPGRETP